MTYRHIMLLAACAASLHAQLWPADSTERRKLLLETARELESNIKTIRKTLFANLPSEQSAIVNQIKFEVGEAEADDFGTCFALRNSQNVRIVIIGSAFSRSLRMYVEAQLIASAKGQPDLLTRYSDYVLDRWKQNLALRNAAQPPLSIEAPQSYMGAPPDLLKAIEEPASVLYGGSLAFAMAHEVAHHVLEHDVDSKKQSIERERDADSWAMDTLLASGQPPAAALMVISYFSSLFEAEGASATHPAPPDRAREMIVRTLANLDRFAPRAKANGVSIDSIREKLESARNQLDGTTSPGVDPEMEKAVKALFRAAPDAFSELRGRITDRDSDSNTYEGTLLIPRFTKCTAYRWRRNGSSYVCRGYSDTKEEAEAIFKFVIQQTCTALANEGVCRNVDPRGNEFKKIRFSANSGSTGVTMSVATDRRRKGQYVVLLDVGQ